jgi:hypothetical protein
MSEQYEALKAELVALMSVRKTTHQVVPGPFHCRWCDCVVRLATGGPFPGEAHDPECFAVRHLERPARMRMQP